MSGLEFLIIVGFFIAFVCVRFGVPLGVCWLISQFDRKYLHPQA